jgi:hypothetical protein
MTRVRVTASDCAGRRGFSLRACYGEVWTALGALGERESGTARLKEAVAAYRAALLERTRARVPRQWATTRNNTAAQGRA